MPKVRSGKINAKKIIGVIDIDTIPPLPATKITTGVFDIATIPNLNSSKITDIHSSKITNIPTSDPGTSGIVWSHRGRLYLS